MIFIGGISSGTKAIEYIKTVICSHCGSYGRYQVFMTYMYFSFFFIPLFKWNKKFYVKMSCCEMCIRDRADCDGGSSASGADRSYE